MDNTLNIAGLAALGGFLLGAFIADFSQSERQDRRFRLCQMANGTSFILLAVIITLGNGWQGYGRDDLVWLVLSGFIGLFVGGTLLFASMNVIGPRRASTCLPPMPRWQPGLPRCCLDGCRHCLCNAG